MRQKIIMVVLSIVMSHTVVSHAKSGTYPCRATSLGTYCDIHPKSKPTKKYNHIAYCGRAHVAITAKQRKVLDAYLRSNNNMILRVKVDDEFIEAPCH